MRQGRDKGKNKNMRNKILFVKPSKSYMYEIIQIQPNRVGERGRRVVVRGHRPGYTFGCMGKYVDIKLLLISSSCTVIR